MTATTRWRMFYALREIGAGRSDSSPPYRLASFHFSAFGGLPARCGS